jgi:hypothetical protein
MEPAASIKKGAALTHGFNVHPSILKLATGIVRQGGELPFLVGRDENPGFQQDLEAVTDPEDQLFLVSEALQGVAQEMGQLHSQDLPGCHVVAVSEASRDGQDLKAFKQVRVFAKSIDVNALRSCARLLESKFEFGIAIGPRSAQYQGTRV